MNVQKNMNNFISIVFLASIILLSYSNGLSQNTNYALQFNGTNDSVIMGYNSILDITGDITICVWYKTNSSNWGALVANYDQYGPDNGYELCSSSVYGQGGFVYFECAYNDDRDGFSSHSTFNDGQWHHVAAVYTPNGISRGKVYVDGILQSGYFWGGSVPLPAIGTTQSYEFKVGAAYGEAYFDGVIDEVSVWDVALTDVEIYNIMYNPLNGTESGLVGYWPFNEGSGVTTHDSSQNNNHGTINGATWVNSNVPLSGYRLLISPDYAYLNNNYYASITGVNTHFSDSLGTSNVWLSKNGTKSQITIISTINKIKISVILQSIIIFLSYFN